MRESLIFRNACVSGLICALFLSYPNIAWMGCELSFLESGEYPWFLFFFAARFFWFWVLAYALLKLNHKKIKTENLLARVVYNMAFAASGFIVYELFSRLTGFYVYDRFVSILIFQFVILGILATTLGYISYLYATQQEKERELAQLKLDSLQSQYNALINQVNPHFFFNSLNGISSLIRKKNEKSALEYIGQLSDIFRYTLQSTQKGLVSLREELDFVEAFRNVMEVRYANKLSFSVDVPDSAMNETLPVLSLLPVLENIITHNIVDSSHPMHVAIYLEKRGLVVSNTFSPRPSQPKTSGIGLQNLNGRYLMLKGSEIFSEQNEQEYRVILPL